MGHEKIINPKIILNIYKEQNIMSRKEKSSYDRDECLVNAHDNTIDADVKATVGLKFLNREGPSTTNTKTGDVTIIDSDENKVNTGTQINCCIL